MAAAVWACENFGFDLRSQRASRVEPVHAVPIFVGRHGSPSFQPHPVGWDGHPGHVQIM